MKAIIKKSKVTGQYRFKLVGANNEPVAQSEPYKTKQAALKTLRKYFPTFEIVLG